MSTNVRSSIHWIFYYIYVIAHMCSNLDMYVVNMHFILYLLGYINAADYVCKSILQERKWSALNGETLLNHNTTKTVY